MWKKEREEEPFVGKIMGRGTICGQKNWKKNHLWTKEREEEPFVDKRKGRRTICGQEKGKLYV